MNTQKQPVTGKDPPQLDLLLAEFYFYHLKKKWKVSFTRDDFSLKYHVSIYLDDNPNSKEWKRLTTIDYIGSSSPSSISAKKAFTILSTNQSINHG
jgi:hypothetical protein